ncbi:MAG: sulfur carrier protein ThiS [Blastocatellia bacterium]|nr:sulfur carrier protein ThiS [Blastocatellia bacterium]
MQVIINGTIHSLSQPVTLTTLIEQLALKPERVAIELNGLIQPRAQWSEVVLQDGDRLEIVHFVGGG